MLSPTEKKIAKALQGDIPLTRRPFKQIAEETGSTEEEVLSVIQGMKKRGIIRKVGAIIRHQRAGITHNAMVVWAVPAALCERVGQIFAAFPEITHCYERSPAFLEKYNIFTMTHLRKGDHHHLVEKLSAASGIKDYLVLFSEEEFKKSSMEYF
jgi:DNA-binding Lrp family transcriptional regulator